MALKDEGFEMLQALPGDEVRQIMWRFADRVDLQMLVQSTRSVARGLVARLVSEGARNTHEWTAEKASVLKAFDEAGLTSAFMDIEHGGFIEGPKNLATSLLCFEMGWVDGGASTSCLATTLALSPIHERGTKAQRDEYMTRATPPQPGEDRKIMRGAFSLTEPIPYVGVDAGMLSGAVAVEAWDGSEDQEPMLRVEKRGRFITNMDFADFVTAAVDTGDERIASSCMVILESTDEGKFDRGSPTRKLVHQLSSTRDPIFSLKIPARRIIGGYAIKDGKIVPRYNHSQIIDAVFRHTRVSVGVQSSAKLLSAIEPVIRYHRHRYRGAKDCAPGTPRYELGIQQKEDAIQRLIDIWATGEAAASLGFEASRAFDRLDPLEKRKLEILAEQGVEGGRSEMRLMRKVEKDALEYLELLAKPEDQRDAARFLELQNDELVQYLQVDAITNVLCPACKLWNTGHGATVMRDAVSLMGGYGITEDCPGFLGQKWMDAQLEATYEGPEAVQRRQLSITMATPLFLKHWRMWLHQMRRISAQRPGTGACALASAMEMWLWTLEHLQKTNDLAGSPLYSNKRQGVTFALADAVCWLLASRYQILDTIELEEKGPAHPVVAEGLPGLVRFFTDLCHVQSARAASEVGRICAELVYGYREHPSWQDAQAGSCCADDKGGLGLVEGCGAKPGDAAGKCGPCVRFDGLEAFGRARVKLDGCLTGARLAKERAAKAVSCVMIPEALDYPS